MGIDLVLVGEAVDLGLGLRGADRGRDDVGADEQQQFRALLRFRPGAEELADDRDFGEEAELRAVAAILGALESSEDDHLAIKDVDEGGGLTAADHRLLVVVDGDVVHDVVHLLVDLELDVAIVTDERGNLEIDGDIFVGHARAGGRTGGAAAGGGGGTGDDRAGFAHDNLRLVVVGGDDGGRGEDLEVALRARVLKRGGERERIDHAFGDVDAGYIAGKFRDRSAAVRGLAKRGAETVDARFIGVGEGDLGDDHLDANLGEDDIDFINQFADETDVINGAADNNRIAALVGGDGEQAAKLGGGVGAQGGGGGRGSGSIAGASCVISGGGGSGLAGDVGAGRWIERTGVAKARLLVGASGAVALGGGGRLDGDDGRRISA